MQDKLLQKVMAYTKMRNIKMPIIMLKMNKGLSLNFMFDNTKIDYKITNLDSAYEEIIQFIEEMYDEYNTPPIRQYKLGLHT